jgi:hypothetical protein
MPGDQRVCELAYRLWERAGWPDGHHNAHWVQRKWDLRDKSTRRLTSCRRALWPSLGPAGLPESMQHLTMPPGLVMWSAAASGPRLTPRAPHRAGRVTELWERAS